LSATLASLTTSIAGIAFLPLGTDQLGRLEAAGAGKRGAAALKCGVDRCGIGPAKLAPSCLLQEGAAARALLIDGAVDPLK
jgi:hypothetical protein